MTHKYAGGTARDAHWLHRQTFGDGGFEITLTHLMKSDFRFFHFFFSFVFRLPSFLLGITCNSHRQTFYRERVQEKQKKMGKQRRGDARFKIHVHKCCSSTREFAISLTAIISSFWVRCAPSFPMVSTVHFTAITMLLAGGPVAAALLRIVMQGNGKK